jgi:hypothetical protein
MIWPQRGAEGAKFLWSLCAFLRPLNERCHPEEERRGISLLPPDPGQPPKRRWPAAPDLRTDGGRAVGRSLARGLARDDSAVNFTGKFGWSRKCLSPAARVAVISGCVRKYLAPIPKYLWGSSLRLAVVPPDDPSHREILIDLGPVQSERRYLNVTENFMRLPLQSWIPSNRERQYVAALHLDADLAILVGCLYGLIYQGAHANCVV